MEIESARVLKRDLLERGINRVPPATPGGHVSPIALGITGRGRDYRLAVRVIELTPAIQARIHQIVAEEARGEAEVKIVGPLFKQQAPVLGASIGHVQGETGTLAAIVTDVADDVPLLLSNNHVLARENNARGGDLILQPGPADQGRAPDHAVGALQRFVALDAGRSNRVDAAVARVADGFDVDGNVLAELGRVAGVRVAPLTRGLPVFKIGRTTGLRRGLVSAFEMDALELTFSMGRLIFDDQIEIRRVGRRPFSLGGDSGALVVDDAVQAVGLLFAGNDFDTSYANPISEVLTALNCRLA